MKFLRISFFFFIALFLNLSAETVVSKEIEPVEESSAFIDLNGLPSGFIAGCVNVITGHYFESENDLATLSPNPYVLNRYYNSGSKVRGELYDQWDLNLLQSIKASHRKSGSRATLKSKCGEIPFVGKKKSTTLTVAPRILDAAVVNVCSPYLSGKNHLLNKEIYVYQRGKKFSYLVNTPGGERLYFAEKKSSEVYFLSETTLSNGSTFRHYYDGKKVERISSFDRNGDLTAELYVDRIGKSGKDRFISVSSDDGRKVSYQVSKMKSMHSNGSHRYCLTAVDKNFGPSVKYRYKKAGRRKREKLIAKEYPNNRFLNIHYYRSDSKKKKVESLRAPVGTDATPIATYRFKYSSDQTDVFDAVGCRKRYRWTKEKRLSQIDEYHPNGKLYRSDHLIWGKKGTSDYTLLKARTLKNSAGTILFAKTYAYDNRGNIIEERVSGNLSGTSSVATDVDTTGNLNDNECETFIKNYEYNAGNLVVLEHDGRQTVRYTYYPHTSMIQLKTVSNEEGIKQRYYYEYDPNGVPTVEIIDDGSSDNIRDLSNVTERRIKRTKTTTILPKGLPTEISELYLDLDSGREVLLKKIVNSYTRQGLLAKEEVYDCHNQRAFLQEWVYDSWGNVLVEIDPIGRQTLYQYDANGNCVKKGFSYSNRHYLYHYDYSNRLIQEEECLPDGTTLCKSYAYDYKGNRVSAIDIYGNEILFEYDGFNRLTKKTLPPIADSDGYLYCPEETYAYNVLNHPIQKTDPFGHTTNISMNAYGKPCRIENPDGSIEQVIYNLDGSVHETIDQIGTRTVFTYDYQSRKVKEEKYSQDGELLSQRKWYYNAFHLLHETDAEGIVTTYHYDRAGRLSVRKRGDSETRYVYDSLGRQHEEWELFEEGQYRVCTVELDLLDRVIEETVQSNTGELYQRKQYAYDLEGNLTHELIYTDSGISTIVTEYNSRGLPVKITSPDGSQTYKIYRYDYLDSSGIHVSYEQVVDPKGNISIIIKNSHGNVVVEERKNIFDETVQMTKMTIDSAGRALQRIDRVIVSGQTERIATTVFEYDSMGREVAVIEAYRDPLQKITRKEYNAFGAVSKIQKPNGTVLEHQYDPLGRLERLHSTDGLINYRYTYDGNHHILTAKDLNRDLCTHRQYDFDGRVLEEKLDHGSKMSYSYDRMGRLNRLKLPDDSTIEYTFDAGHLLEISRQNGEAVLKHSYAYGLSGKIVSMDLANGLGAIVYGYDSSLRPIEILSPYLRYEAQYDSCGNPTIGNLSDPIGEIDFCYQYSSLEQLISETGVVSQQYQFDSLGNRLVKNAVAYHNNALNQLESQGNVIYTYDSNGNLSSKSYDGKTTRCQYDPLDRLVEVSKEHTKTVYQYDPFHRRTGKISYVKRGNDWIEVKRENYLYQGNKEIGVVNQNGEIEQLKIMGIGDKQDVGAAVLVEIAGKPYVTLNDYRGNISILLDADTGEVVETYRYSAYGEETVVCQREEPINPWRYCGKRVDPETGWVHFGERYYDPEVGRWTTPDPLWFVDGANLYQYVNNRPTIFVDPEGLFLDSLFGLVKNTLSAMLEWVCDISLDGSYSEQGAYVYAGGPICKHDRQKFDRKSHGFRSKENQYGMVHCVGINGINNSLEESHSSCEHVSRMSEGCSYAGVYNATHGLWDLVECFVNMLGYTTRPVSLLHREWNEYFKNCEEGGIIIHYCHSQGAIQTRNALASYDPELRQRIHVIAVAPGAYIDRGLCGSVAHLVSKWDFVPWIDIIGRMRNRDTTLLLNRHPDASYFDHAFRSPTYENAIRDRIDYIRERYGDRRL